MSELMLVDSDLGYHTFTWELRKAVRDLKTVKFQSQASTSDIVNRTQNVNLIPQCSEMFVIVFA